MLMRVVTDINVFDIGILEVFFFFFFILCLPDSSQSVDLFDCHSPISQTQLQYQHMISACRLHKCLIL